MNDVRAPYLWHLKTIQIQKQRLSFDRAFWWKDKEDKVEPAAALYELVRRHPLVGTRIKNPKDLSPAPPVVIWLRSGSLVSKPVALKSWPALTSAEKHIWKSLVGHLKGVDCRAADEQCVSLKEAALLEIQVERQWQGKKREDHWQSENQPSLTATKDGEQIIVEAKNHPPTADEWENAIAACAASAWQKGQLIIAVAPDLTEEQAEELMMQKYREHRNAIEKMHGTVKQRARPGSWLDLIVKFETAAASEGRAYSPDFNPYRKVMDSIRF